MPDQQPIRDPLERARETEREILYLLTNPEDNQPLWSVEELARELGERLAVEDAIGSLVGAGLIHRPSDGFVCASRAAVRQIQIVGRVG
jgi:hypothetical protein